MSVAGKRILLIGDSHTVGGYGSTLSSLFQQAGARVTKIAHVGATARDYLTGQYAAEFRTAARQGADILVITLGTNDAAWSDSIRPSKTAQNIKDIATTVGAPIVFWVGPPAFNPEAARRYNPSFAQKDLNARSDEVWLAVSPLFGSRAVDPRAVTKPFTENLGPSATLRNGEIHFGPQGGRAWAEHVFGIVTNDAGTGRGGEAGSMVSSQTQPPKGVALGVLVALAVVFMIRLGIGAKTRFAGRWKKGTKR